MSAVGRWLGVWVDPCQGDAAARRLHSAAKRGDWPEVQSILGEVSDPDELSFYVQTVRGVQQAEQWLGDVVGADPNNILAQLLFASRAIGRAIEEAPSRQDGSDLPSDWLRRAESALDFVLRQEPGNVAAWSLLVTTSRGLGHGIAETKSRFAAVIEGHPTHLYAHRQMLQQLRQKWGGSHEAMHTFAREAALKAPPGSALGCLIAEAHIEHWLATRSAIGTLGYFRSPAVRAELHEAADRSVRHPSYVERAGYAGVHNDFAMAFSFAGEHKAAREQFRTVRGRVTQYPWGRASQLPVWLFRNRRVMAYLIAPFARA